MTHLEFWIDVGGLAVSVIGAEVAVKDKGEKDGEKDNHIYDVSHMRFPEGLHGDLMASPAYMVYIMIYRIRVSLISVEKTTE